jgi:hypothetical protein
MCYRFGHNASDAGQLPAELASDARAILLRDGAMRSFFAFFFFFARHFQSIVSADIDVSGAVFGYGVLIERLFILLSELESRKARFYMSERFFFFFMQE